MRKCCLCAVVVPLLKCRKALHIDTKALHIGTGELSECNSHGLLDQMPLLCVQEVSRHRQVQLSKTWSP